MPSVKLRVFNAYYLLFFLTDEHDFFFLWKKRKRRFILNPRTPKGSDPESDAFDRALPPLHVNAGGPKLKL